MWLTQRQRKRLEFYTQFRHKPLKWFDLFRAYALVYAFRLMLVLVAIVIYGNGYPAAALMLLCLIVGAQGRDAAWQNGFLAFWPALHEVIDWDKLERLLESQTGAPRPDIEE